MNNLLAKPPNQARHFVLDFFKPFKINEKTIDSTQSNTLGRLNNLLQISFRQADTVNHP
jgi:hypothetical protein